MTVYLAGLGAYVPQRVVSNETLAAITGLDAGFIHERTGITQRHLARAGVGTVHMATVAAREALFRAGVAPESVGLVVVVSSFHRRLPGLPTAEAVRLKLGLDGAVALDIGSPLTGFMTAIQLAHGIVEGEGRAALIVGAEGFSEATQLKDRRTCYLFSDGAGAAVLTANGGFARVKTLLHGTMEAPKEPLGRWECSVATRSGQGASWRALRAAVERLSGESETLHVPSQGFSEPESVPRGVKIHRPLGETGDFASASLPLSLYRFVRDGEYSDGDDILAFSTDGLASWNACLLAEIRGEARGWDDLSKTNEQELERGRWRGERAAVEVASVEELRGHLVTAAEDGARLNVGLASIAFDLTYSDPVHGVDGGETAAAVAAPAASAAEREVAKLLQGQIRATDVLHPLEGGRRYVLVLRYIDPDNAQVLANRLRHLVEDLDPAGQLKVTSRVEVIPFAGGPAADFADAVLRALG